jgi:hypothetical protein
MATSAHVSAAGTSDHSGNHHAHTHPQIARRKLRPTRFRELFFLSFVLVLLAASGLLRAQQPAAETPFPCLSPPSPSTPVPSCVIPAASSCTHDRELTFKDRTDLYLKSLHEPEALVRPLLGAGYDQLIDTPPQWGQGGLGYGRRLASGFASEMIARTIKFGVAAADHEDPRFYHSQLQGFRPRLRYAVVHTFISPVDGGGQTFAFSRFAGIYGAAFISNAWYPPGYNDFAHALSRGSTNLAVDVGVHVLREFAPDIKSRLVFHLR